MFPSLANFAVAGLLATCLLNSGIAPASVAKRLNTVIPEHRHAAAPFKSRAGALAFDRARLVALRLRDELDLAIPGEPLHTVVFDRIEEHGGGIRSSIGYLKHLGREFRVILTSGPDGTFGSIRTPQTVYRVVPGNGHDWIVDSVEERKFHPSTDLRDDILNDHAGHKHAPSPADIPVKVQVNKAAPLPGAQLAAPAGQATIDVMIAYTGGFATRLGAGLMTRLYSRPCKIQIRPIRFAYG